MADTNIWGDMQLDPYSQATATTANAVQAAPLSGYTAQTGTASQINPNTVGQAGLSTWGMDNNQLVESRLNNMLSQGSDYLTLAQTGAKQQAAKSGLLNSSMAAGAGQVAAIQSALPIAQQDATTYANRAQFNAGQANDNAQFNANLRFNVADRNAGYGQQMAMANMDAVNAAGQFAAQQRNTGLLENAKMLQDANQFNAQQANAISEANAGRSFDAATAQLQANMEMFKATTDQQTQLAMAGIESQYNITTQATESAQNVYQQAMREISLISTSKGLTATAKTTAINNQLQMLKSNLDYMSKLNDLELSQYLNFSTTTPALTANYSQPAWPISIQ
jgi:hypothetical protein